MLFARKTLFDIVGESLGIFVVEVNDVVGPLEFLKIDLRGGRADIIQQLVQFHVDLHVLLHYFIKIFFKLF